MVKRDGYLVAFADVERALQRLATVERVVVVAGAMTPRGREFVAICTLAPDSTDGALVLRRLAAPLLPGHALPDRFVVLDQLPVTATGKPDRGALAALVASGP